MLSSRNAVLNEIQQNINEDWQIIKYKYNRAIMHDGDFPHLSTPIREINSASGLKRVVLGLNCFTETVGECCMRAPEHSLAFNRTVKLYQKIASLTGSKGSMASKYEQAEDPEKKSFAESNILGLTASTQDVDHQSVTLKNKSLSVSDIKRNPALAKLLVAAAKKVKAIREKEYLNNETTP